MAKTNEVVIPRIVVADITLQRDEEGNYLGCVKRPPWDVRVGQDWLREHPDKWEPAPI